MRGLVLAFACVVAGCGPNVATDASDLCLTWSDAGPVSTSIPEALACEPVAGTSITPPGDYEVAYVCIADDGSGCPGPAAAHESFARCVGEVRFGPGCDHPVSGACTTRETYAACGPDPSASGACCYYALVTTSTYLTRSSPPAGGRGEPVLALFIAK